MYYSLVNFLLHTNSIVYILRNDFQSKLFQLFQEECFEALESISRKINTNDADMRSHVILSMIKVYS